jgi:hypothetical protein
LIGVVYVAPNPWFRIPLDQPKLSKKVAQTMRVLLLSVCLAGLATAALAQNAPTNDQNAPAKAATAPKADAAAKAADAAAKANAPAKPISPADAKNHIGENAIVCGKVVDAKVPKYGIAGRGKPIVFNLDQADPNPIFFFTAFGTEEGGPKEVIEAYKGKDVCVTGVIVHPSAGPPCIFVSDRSAVKVTQDSKPVSK